MKLRSLLALSPALLITQCAPECAPPPDPAAVVTTVPGDCDSYRQPMADAGLPVDTFIRIMRRESGCNPDLWVHDRDDDGGAGFGLNFIGSMRGYWPALCGMTKEEAQQGNAQITLILSCVEAEYAAHGLRAWS